mmetsp:Transcript_151953/g.268302  ORF Transcript_151953/g.268302 Transcript_151953/m.268302 type:complete len:894 (-) Transcript_151953:7-2688(-)
MFWAALRSSLHVGGKKTVKEVPRPHGVHAYLSFDNGGAFGQGAKKSDSSAMDAATHWRDVEIRRGFAKDPAVYAELLQNGDWKQAEGSTTRDFRTGARHLKYDKEGNIRLQGYMRAKYKPGQSPALDAALQKLFATYGIEDRTSGVLLNYYEDGKMMLGSHRHDCWTALFSFGSDRILTIDNTPLLCRDGDLINFGTQRHGVPLMPEISEGRITVPVFFYPDKLQKQAMWQTITDAEEAKPSAKFATMLSGAGLSLAAENNDMERKFASEILQLCQLGFPEDLAKEALMSHDFNVEKAVQVLLEVHGNPSIPVGDRELGGEACEAACCSASIGRWRSRRVCAEDTQSCTLLMQDPKVSEEEAASQAAALALHLGELERSSGMSPGEAESCALLMQDSQVNEEEAASQAAALAMHLDELERGNGMSAVLQAQFQQYEAEIDRLDVEDRWNGTNGDLMAIRKAQELLTLEDMEKATVYSIGHGDLHERAFFEILQLNSVRVLYDTRPTDYRHELLGIPERFEVSSLKMACKNRGIFYKRMVVGRESAYGTLAHLRSEQGKHVLIELAWQARRKATAFLGQTTDWQLDPRLAIAQDLCAAGHHVKHISSDGSVHEHVQLGTLPDWLVTEEERLRKLEKQRQSGELKRPQKSAADRSSEVVASRSMRPADEIDAMAALREAETQPELKLVQQRLARIQRVAEKKELPNKVLTNTPGFIKEEARAQADWIAQRKLEKQKQVPSKANQAQQGVSSSAEDGGVSDLQVECARCGLMQNWTDLQEGDGVCLACRDPTLGASTRAELEGSASPELQADLLVECRKCGEAQPWNVLALGDGFCSRCFEKQEEDAAAVSSQPPALPSASCAARDAAPATSAAAAAGSWRSRRHRGIAQASSSSH